MTALFFGSSERRLFGVHHGATARNGTRHAALLCYPGVQEYNSAHWDFRRLAGMLERAGLDVLRFDYYATGDSAGDGNEGRLGIWVDNVVEAAAELTEIARTRTLSVVGMRLGATLALEACAEKLQARTLVLWEPVVSGREYIDELEDLDHRRKVWLMHGDRTARTDEELLGYALSPELRGAILAIDACQLPVPKAERVLIVAEEARPSYTRLRESLARRGVTAEIRVVAEPAERSEGGQRERAKLSHAALVEITKQLEQGAA